jgi:hypothetical protein
MSSTCDPEIHIPKIMELLKLAGGDLKELDMYRNISCEDHHISGIFLHQVLPSGNLT